MKVNSFWSPPESDFETVVGVSATIPDQSLSVRDILYRFTRGTMELPSVESGDDESFDDIHHFDDDLDAYESFQNGVSLSEEVSSMATSSSIDREGPNENFTTKETSSGPVPSDS